MINKDFRDQLLDLLQISHEITWYEAGEEIYIGMKFKIKITITNIAPSFQVIIQPGPIYRFKNITLNFLETQYAKIIQIAEPLDNHELGPGEQSHVSVLMEAAEFFPKDNSLKAIIDTVVSADFDYESYFKMRKCVVLNDHIKIRLEKNVRDKNDGTK